MQEEQQKKKRPITTFVSEAKLFSFEMSILCLSFWICPRNALHKSSWSVLNLPYNRPRIERDIKGQGFSIPRDWKL